MFYGPNSPRVLLICCCIFIEIEIIKAIGNHITVEICYLEHPLSQTFTMSNFLFGLFSIHINFPYKSLWYLELRYLELSLCWTMFSVRSVIFGLFPICYIEHSKEVFEWIILFISGIRMLITALTKLCSKVCFFFFSTSFRQQHVLSSAKIQCKKFRRDVGEKYDVPCCEGKFYWDYKCIKYFELVSFSRSCKRYTGAFAKIQVIACVWRS